MAGNEPLTREKRVTAGTPVANGSDPAVATGDHVFVLPDGETTPPSAAAILKEQGSTAHFQAFYDTTLGPNGSTLAQAVLDTAEADYTALQGWFGGITPPNLPFVVNVVPGSGGASHANCAATTLNCDAFSGTDSDLVRMLVVAEADEVFMAAQNKGWDCGASNGEGLSRVLATERYPAQLDGFASASSWLNSSRPDYVSVTDPTDRNYISIGCATLFINYLRYQLGHSLNAIIAAGGATLQDTYASLTGSSNAFAPFAALLATHFPPGTPVNLPNDNPFPLKGTGTSGQMWHTIRDPDGSWQKAYGLVEGQEQNDPGAFMSVACGGVGGALQVVGITQEGQMWHTIRNPDGSWQKTYGLVEGQEQNNPGPFTTVGAAGVGGTLQLVGLTRDGRMWHTIRNANGSWQKAYGLVEGQEQNNPGAFMSVACGGVGGALQVVGITQDGQMWHTIRNPDGSWQKAYGLVEGQEQNNPGPFMTVGAAGVGDVFELVGLTRDGRMWHTIRNANGSWQKAYGLVEGQEQNNPGAFMSVACGGVGGALQVVGTTQDGQMWHTIRNPDGSWQKTYGLVEGQEQNNPGPFTSVGCAGVGSALQLIGLTK